MKPLLGGRRHTRRYRIFGGLAAALAGSLVIAACSSSSSTPSSQSTATSSSSSSSGSAIYTGSGTVGYLFPTATITRWLTQDIPDYKSQLKIYAPNVKVLVYNANLDVSTQLSQAQAAITQGARVLVVSSVAADQAAGLVSYANRNHVPVIVDERSINNADTCCMVGDDPLTIGVALGRWAEQNTTAGQSIAVVSGDPTDDFAVAERAGIMSVLSPLFKSGQRKLVDEVWTPGWDPTNARTEMEAILTRAHDKVNAVVSANDDMAQTIIAAVQHAGLTVGTAASDVKVTGIDATLDGVQSVARGWQAMTVFRPYVDQARVAAEATAYLLAGKPFPSGLFPSTLDNGLKTIPFYAAPAIVLTQSTVGNLISEGVYTKSEVCNGLPAGSGPC